MSEKEDSRPIREDAGRPESPIPWIRYPDRQIYRTLLLFALVLLVGCPPPPPPHPTRPTKVDCRVQVETRFSALIDAMILPIDPANDPLYQPLSACDTQGPGTSFQEWTQVGWTSVPICVAAGTTLGQAAAYCSSRLESSGYRVGNVGPAPPALAPYGQICPGSLVVLSSRIVALGSPPVLHPDECREGTSWPLVP
jgi:hypothetical protein